ncbi:MAG TPA: alanine racemase [Gaiellaceae bacterium]
MRSEITIDLRAVQHNARTLLRALDGAELWAVVKSDAYGHGAIECSGAALDAGATGLCVATVGEGLELRARFPEPRILVLGPTAPGDVAAARDAGLAVTVPDGRIPEDVEVHLKLDTGMGRWGLSELPAPTRRVAGLMTHLATADTDIAFAREQIERFRTATAAFPAGLVRHVANSAAALRLPESRFDAARCGIALYGLSPFGLDPAADGLRPVLSWRSEVAQVKLLHAGESTGYRRRFVAGRDTWIAIVPVGYGDGFRRDLGGTEVLVGDDPARVVGVVSMNAVAVELGAPVAAGAPVTLVGPGVPLEAHAEVAGTITYELACGIGSSAARTPRTVVDA